MRSFTLGLATIIASTAVAQAQVGSTIKDSAKATGQTAAQVGDTVKSSVESEPNKSVDKAKAKVHKAKAKHDAHEAKEAAKEIPK